MLHLEREVGGEPIILVEHSLGGILMKESFHWSKSNITARYQELHGCTKHTVFLGISHRGSPMANMGEILLCKAGRHTEAENVIKNHFNSLEPEGKVHAEEKKEAYLWN